MVVGEFVDCKYFCYLIYLIYLIYFCLIFFFFVFVFVFVFLFKAKLHGYGRVYKNINQNKEEKPVYKISIEGEFSG